MQSTQQDFAGKVESEGHPSPADASSAIIDEGVIHDLLNPLTGLMGHLQLLQELLEDGAFELSRQRIKGCFDSLSILLGMLFDLQQLLRLNAAAVQPNCEELRVQKLMNELRAAYDSSIDADERELVIECADGELSVTADAQLLSRALVLLLSVARRLSRRGPVVIRVCASPSATELKFEVSYEGMTLPPAISGQVFASSTAAAPKDAGHRVDRGRGLMLVQAVAHLHRGATAYEPTDAGGQFTLTLPFTG